MKSPSPSSPPSPRVCLRLEPVSQRTSSQTLTHRNMGNGSMVEIPSIVTKDLSSTLAIHIDDHDDLVSPALPTMSISHSRKPSDPTLLGPRILKPGRHSLKVISPSPTLSTVFCSLCDLRSSLGKQTRRWHNLSDSPESRG